MSTVVPQLDFSKSWENPADFPTYESEEIKVRADLQLLHNEVRTYLNETVQPLLQRVANSVPSVSVPASGAFLRMQPQGPVWEVLTDVSEVGA